MSAEFWDAWLNVCLVGGIFTGLLGAMLAISSVDGGKASNAESKAAARKWARNALATCALCTVTAPFIIELRHDATPTESQRPVAAVVAGR